MIQVKFIGASPGYFRTYYREIDEPKRFFCAQEEPDGTFSIFTTDAIDGEPNELATEKLELIS